MKKFAKILGFLGFFVTLATAQIGTAWAEKCDAGFYWSGEYKTCKACPGHTFINGVEQGVYCPGGDFTGAGYDEGLYGCMAADACGTVSYWLTTPGTNPASTQCTGTCQKPCTPPADCTPANNCYPLFVNLNGTATCVTGDGVCNVEDEECKTVTCPPCYEYDYTAGECVPKSYKAPQYKCSQGGSVIWTDSVNPTYGETYTVDPQNQYLLCNVQNGEQFRGWKLNSSYGPYQPRTDILGGWPCVDEPAVFVADIDGCEEDQYWNGSECKPCDTASGFHSQPGSVGEHACKKSCHRNCAQQHSTEQNCAEGVEGFYTTTDLIYGTEYQDQPEQCFDDNNTEIFAPNTDPVPAHWCTWNCEGCSNPQCYDYVDGACVPKKFKATYECNGTTVHTDSSIEYLSTYPIANVSCAPQTGQEFEGWLLNLETNQTPYNSPDTLPWKWCSDGIFQPQMSDKTLYIEYVLYNGNFVSGNGPASNPEPFTVVDLAKDIKWIAERQNSSFKGWCDAPYYGQDTTWLSQHCVETIASSSQWFQIDNNNLPALLNGGDTVSLYAWWECTGPYTLNSNYQCEGDKIDVKYTCSAPENTDYNDTSYIYSNAATYGQEYKPVKSVEDVAEESNPTACQFTGYEIDPDQANTYEWTLLGSTSNSPTNGKYRPGSSMNEWQYISPTPTTEIEFELKSDVWKAKTYLVEYHCGTINDNQVQGGAILDNVTYNAPYFVAHDNILADFLERCDETLGGTVSGYTLQDWTFTCDAQSYGNFNTGDPIANPNAWTYDSNNCYFTANWAQTDFVIILDQNGATSPSYPSDYLYTRLNSGVYLDSDRTKLMKFDPNEANRNPLDPTPKKTFNVNLYPGEASGASFEFGGVTYNSTNAPAGTSVSHTFNGFYQNTESSPKQYIDSDGYITEDGHLAGREYNADSTEAQRTWVANWTQGSLTLPEPTAPAGYTYNGWSCVNGAGITVYSCTNQSCSVTVDQNLTCTAQWTEACYEIKFNDNGGTPSSNGTHPSYYKKYNDDNNKWYTNATCASVDDDPTVANNMPSKEHATFTGYYDETQNPDLKIFAGTNDTPQGGLTSDGAAWTVSDNATLYAQYECDDLYHLMDDGSCGSCPGGSFYNPSSTNPDHCDTCADILGSNWTSKEGYTWSIDQCYRNCGTDTNDDIEECAAVTTPSGHGFEQFITPNGGTGRQISFYGNERQNIYTCRSATGATKCPLGLLDSENASGSGGGNRPMAAAVRFNNIATGENESRYIIGNRAGGLVLELTDGFAWSQVVGAGQQSPEITNTIGGSSETYHYTFITYPADTAPAATPREHQTFVGYGYPETDATELVNARNLTADNANGIIQFAKNLDPAQNNMSPDTRSQYSRNLWPIYTDDPTYTLTYLCNGGETPSTDHQVTGLYVGTQFNLSTPNWCTGCYEFTGWWDGSQIITPEQFTNFTWNYNSNMTFIAQCAESTDKFIIYNKIPVSNVNASDTTENGNTYVPANGGTPPTFTCGDGTATNITGQPQLKNSDDVVIGTVIEWCKDSDLEECDLPLELQNSNCTNKNVYAKWECTDSRYHLNETKDDCVVCNAGEYWDEDDEVCKSCSALGNGWTSKPGYNQSIDQCYRICNGGNGTTSTSCTSPDGLSYTGFSVSSIVNGETHQIEFYGNWRNRTNNPELDVCGANAANVEYCARLIGPVWSTNSSNRLMSSKMTFKKDDNNGDAGTRHLVGYTSAQQPDLSNILFVGNNKIWTHIMGPGQYTTGDDNRHYVYAIYPTDTAPNPGDTGARFMGYYDAQNGGVQRVAAALGLDSTNAVAFAQSPLSLNQIGDRILYPQYCENGQEWNGSACIGTDYTVKYICGAHGADVEGMSMENTATYGQSYKVAYSGAQKIAECNPNTGYVLKTNNNDKPVWKFNGNGNDIEYYTGEEFQWISTISSPTFTAQYDCAAGYTANGDVNDGGNCVLGVFTVTYDCGIGTGGSAPDSDHPVSTNGTYNVLPNGTANGGVVDCNFSGQGFAGWKFSGNENTYNGDDQIGPWIYGNETLTAQYRLCNSNEVLVNGVCYPKCNDTTCTEPTPQNSQSHCPTDHTPPYPNNVTCSYAGEDISGYLDGGVCRYANGDSQGQPINIGVCQESVECNDSAYVWNSDPTVWACEPNTGITYNVQFKCNETDTAPISGYSFSVSYGQSITIPSNSACPRTGYSYSQWKATQYDNPATLEAQNSTRTIDWNYTHNETFIADWNDGNVYHVNLHAYSCDDPTNPDLTGTFNSYTGVQELWEKYNVAWYKNAGLDDQITTLSSLQLPTLSGWMFGGYNKTDGMPRLSCDNGTCENLSPTLIRDNEDWCAVWSKCNANEYWNNGDCISCSTATGGQYPYAAMGATSINDCYNRPCYRDCQPNFSACNIPHAETYTYVNESFIGSMYFPNTNSSACQLDIWLPETSGTVPNCQCRVATCETGYHANTDNTACLPDTHIITLNSHIDGFDGHVSSPTVLYTKYDHGAYLESSYIRLMGTNGENPLDSVPEKSANVVLYGNGGTFTWNGYPVQQATAPANFAFQGFFVSEYANGAPYINNNGVITSSGDQVAKQNQSNSTVWHAQWQDGSITLPDAQRQCYTFGGWWTDVYNGVSAGNANMPYTPTGATTNLYAHWTPGTYSITYHNGNAIYSGCSTTSYTFGNAFTINCSITPQAGSHKVFNGWCTNPELTAGCTQNPVISNTDCGDKDYYAWWGCESGYNLENGVCVPNASELCPAQLSANAHASLVDAPTISNNQCTYKIQCNSCLGLGEQNYFDCYTYGASATNGGIFTITGNTNDSTVLNNAICEPATYNAVYKCGTGIPGGSYTHSVTITYNDSYTVLPNGTENGGVVTCSKEGERFNHWTFNLNSGAQYTGGESINAWRYHGATVPTFTAQYGQCPEGEVLVDGECKPMCTKNCIYPGANPGACPSNYPTNAICAYDPSSNPVIGYRPSLYSNKCLDVDYPHDPVVANQCDVTAVTCPTHYEWNPVTLKCDPKIYQVRLDANGGTTSFGFVSKLFEKYSEGWGKNETGSFIPNLQLSSSELPTGADISQIFTGYGINCNSTARMISADGTVLASPTTLVDNDQTWYACYGPNTDATFTIKFRCTANGQDIYVQNVHVGESINVPATGVCPGVAFNQWKSTLNQPVITLPAGAISVQWNHYFDEVFIPDTKAVYHVDLNANGGTFPSNDYQQLWYAVDMGWYKNEALTQPINSSTIPSSYLPTNQGSSFNGWFTDPISGEQRGNMISSGWWLPNSISTDEEWWAHWGQCELGQFWIGGECKSCSEATYGQYPLSDAGATSVTQCYKPCSICLNGGCPTIHGANCVYNSNDPSVQNNGKNYNNGIDTCVPNSMPAPNCPYTITDCNEPGWIPAQDGQSCVEDEKHTITLDAHIIHGVGSDPDVLYTWHNRGVYLYSNYTGEMTTSQNPINDNPLNYAIVTFDLNGQGASLVWNGQTYTGTMNANVLFDYQGFWKSVNGSPRYIGIDGYITENGRAAGMGYTDDTTWHARWQPRTLGTVSQSGNDLPQPTRPGYSFDGWYDLPVGGNQVYSSSLVNNDMTVYARWSDEIYTVNLVSDRNNCQLSNNTPTKLYEKYNVGWNRYTTGTFDPNLTLTDDELPTPNAGYIFDGYYDAPSGGQRVIRSDGRVIQEPNYTDNTHTWYARCVRPNGPFTVTFKCDTDGHVVQSGSVNYGANVTAPTVADANCTKPGHTFNKWKAVVNNENIVFNAGGTYNWGYYSGADFVPQWVLDAPYHVTLDQNGATQSGVTDLYEKYGMWWSQYQSGNPPTSRLSGNALPRKTGFNFGGYENANGVTMGTYSSTTGVWTLPLNTTVTGDETWTAIWSECGIGEYWDGYKCYPCPDGFTDNPHAIGAEQCYGNCEYDCQDSGCPSPLPVGMQSCTPNHSGYPQWGIKYNRPGATCLPQGQQSLPICPNDIICNNGYDLVGTECRDGRYTITLNSNLYNDNGIGATPSTLYTWRNHGVYSTSLRRPQDEMTPEGNPVNRPSTSATLTLNGNGATFDWHGMSGAQLSDNVQFVFDGFYDITNATTNPVIGIDGYITADGQSIGMDTQSNLTWRASWRNGSVDLPSISRDGYTFDGWWTECNGGTRVSMGDQTIAISGDLTLCAHWSGKSYTVTYNCDNEGGQGGAATDSQLAYQNTTYTVRENFIPCHKDADVSNGTRYHEFENWKFNLNPNSYWPGDSIMWIFNADNPTFNAHYEECPNGWYFDGSCKQCPNGYTNSDIDADSATKCYKTCDVQCTQPTSQCPMNEEGVLTCTYPNNTYPLGKQYSGSDDCIYDETVPACEPFTIMCKPGYTPDYYLSTDTGTHCTKLADHEITLAANCGQGTVIPGNQEKLYTTENTGVYLDPARTNTYQMGLNSNPLVSGDWARCIVTATFNHCDNNDPNCDGATIEQKTVDLGFNGYYKAETNGTRYTDTRQEDGQLKSYITQNGIDAGKGYTTNATWFAQWLDGQVGSQKWPNVPTHTGTCGVTYEFVDWYTAANGGTVVSPATPINSNVTWYAHWCESCPTGAIANGSCSDAGCVARFTCNDGYYWNADNCSCVLSPDTRFTLTYKPNGGTPTQPRTQSLAYGETFPTLGGDTFTKSGEVLCHWDEENHASSNTFPEAVAELSTEYTYLNEENITLLAHWAPCQCTQGAAGVQDCSFSVVNNACVPTVTCMPGYIPNGTPTCAGECNATCDTSTSCRICSAGTYQDGNECKPCPEGFTSNDGATSCYGNTISIDWDENGGNAIIPDGSCVYGETFTLANAPSHSNSAMQFLGWKLANGDIRLAGASVMCDFTHVGVYSGTSTAIQAQWNECQCSDQLDLHVAWCQAWFADGECKYMNGCDAGYEPDPLTVYTPAAVCNPKNYNITYNCGDGIGSPEYLTDSATFNENYTVKGRGTCRMTGFNFVGWKFSANNQTYQPGYRFEPWNFTQQNPTFTAQYSQCAAGEVWVNGACEPCTCPQENWGAGVTQCVASPSSTSTCSALVSCNSGYYHPQGNCNGATCSAQCDQIQSNAIYVCGDDATGTPPATETMNYGATHTVKGQASCIKSGHTFNGWNFTGTNENYNPGATVLWNYETNQTFTGNWCKNCVQPDHGECSLNAGVAGMCSYNCNCNAGYTLVGGVCTAHPVCERSEYNITYQPNDGMNNGVLGQPVIQDVTYGVGFTTKDGTIFTMENSIITAWDSVDGGNYPDLNAWYQYNTVGDTVLDAHWEQCTCTLGTGAESCGTLSTAGNACNWTNPVCQNGYVSPDMQCSGTGNTNCTLTCGECAEGEIIVDGQCVPCTCATGTGAASCTPGATANNTCTAVGQCLVGYGNENGNANVVCGGTNCVVSYNECGDGWVSNENCQCNECPANTYQSGNTCVPCQNGYTSPAGSSSADACVPGAHTIHYLSNNGASQTYDQSVTYGQSFMTEGGTRFTYTNHIMTHWNVESGASSTFTNGTATLSGNYVYNDATDTTLSAQWAQCECDADGCTTYATNSNECACNASEESCSDGYIYGGCECNGTNCAPICTLLQSNAIYNCGTGTGIPPVSELVSYGTPYTIKANATVYGCSRENSTFAGWEFDGDQQIHAAGDTVTWNYTTDKNFRAVYCNNCLPEDHCTLDIPNPGECVVTCHTGYEWDSNLKKCVAKTYPGDEGITYKPNGGTPNRNYTQSVTYDAPFTTLDWSVEHYTKAHHILTRWDVESGGAGTFNGGYAALGTEYTYHTDGATVLAADWTECATDEISLNNTCRQCGCTTGTGAASCGTLSTDDDTCTWGPVSCQTGYVTPVLDCSNDTTNCTASCTPCGTTQVEVNGTCTDCVCNVGGDDNGIISGCGFASNNGNTCNWNPTTCKLGYGNPNLTCDDSGYNNNCEASCTICPAGTYGDNGVECKQCPEGYTSLAGATSIRECFIDPNSCASDEHIEHGECVSNERACSIPDATSAVRIWNPAIGTYGPCTVQVDGCNSGYHVSGNVCVKNTEACTVEHGHGEHDWNGTSWGACGDVVCDPGYEPNSDYTACVECSNRRVNGDIAVSGYIYECEIAACMYQGQKYALQNGECVPICENASDETGTKVWDERTKKCIRTCNPGYKMW